MKNKYKKVFLVLFLLSIVLVVGLYFPEHALNIKKEYSSLPPFTANGFLSDFDNKNFFPSVDIEAKSAIILDLKEEEVIFEKNSSLQLPLASLAKIMTATVADDILKQNNGLRPLVEITADAVLQSGDDGFFVNEHFNVEDALDIMLLASSNDMAYALAKHLGNFYLQNPDAPVEAFVSRMNQKAKELGLQQTYFLNPTGLDVSKNLAGAYGSAKDIASIADWIVAKKPEMFEITSSGERSFVSFQGFEHTFKNTNRLVYRLPSVIGGKTGFEDLAGGNLVVVVDAGFEHPLIIVVLGSSEQGRFDDIETLYKASLEYFAMPRSETLYAP